MRVLLALLLAQSTLPSVDTVLPRIQANLDEIVRSLPDFVCHESVISERLSNGSVTRTGTWESRFRGTQEPGRGDRGVYPFTESREIVTMGGRPASFGQKPNGPMTFNGGFSSMLSTTFAAKNTPWQDYSIAGMQVRDGRELLVIHFATKPGQKELGFGENGHRRVSKDSGDAWVDPVSLQIVRLERRWGNLSSNGQGFNNSSVDYAPVTVAGKTVWMPKTVKAEMTEVKSGKEQIVGRYRAEYSDYHRFGAETDIKYN